MKKIISVTIISSLVAFFILTIAGFSYAFLITSVESNNLNPTTSGDLDITYTKGEDLTGNLLPSSSKDDNNLNTTVVIKKTSESSLDAGVNIYLKPTVLPTELAIVGLKWEVYGYQGSSLVYSNSGTFSGAVEGTPIPLVSDFELSTTETTFTIYVWLNGDEVVNGIMGKSFKGVITAESSQITGTL